MKLFSQIVDDVTDSSKDRTRIIAMSVSAIGIVITSIIFSLSVISKLNSSTAYVEATFYILVLVTVFVSSLKNFKVKEILNTGLSLILFCFWVTTFFELKQGDPSLLVLAEMLYVPMFLVMSLNNRLILILAPLQGFLVYLFFSEYAIVLQTSLSDLPVICGLFSCLSFVFFASVGSVRKKQDKLLFDSLAKNKTLASTDDLTKLMNRRSFNETLKNVWQEDEPFIFAYVDLDRFKPINDQYGHAAGDEFLRQFALRMAQSSYLRYAARLGGDEFAFILKPGYGPNEAQILIPQIHKVLTADILTEYGVLNAGCSIGYAIGKMDVHSIDDLIHAAEYSMRRAKTGAYGWARFNQAKDPLEFSLNALEEEFRTALKQGHIQPALQPIICGKTGKTGGYELLARWVNSPFSRDPRPDEFIPVAEKMGLLDQLLWTTLESVLKNKSFRSQFLAVNVSPSQILGIDFLDKLVARLDAYGVAYENIILEITEQVAFRSLDQNITVLQKVRDLGMSVAMDDFGAGYSSLSLLDSLPINKIKIDQSLLHGLGADNRKNFILRAVIDMSHQLDLVCCVEGVETEEQAAYLSSLGVDELQGYWLGRPSLVKGTPSVKKVA